MKRTILALACTATAALLAPALAVPAQAQARAADPATAVKQQFKTGHGVAFTERTSIKEGATSAVFLRRTGKFQFGTSGVTASDISSKPNITSSELDALDAGAIKGILQPERTIRIGTTSYLSGGLFAQYLPKGAVWLKVPGGPPAGLTSMIGQPISATEPTTLKTLLASGKRVSGGYTGHTTFAQLWKVSKWFRATQMNQKPSASAGKTPVTWKLTVNGKGLPTRLVSSYSGRALGSAKSTVTTDTAFTAWGGRVSIKAPDPASVGNATDLDFGDLAMEKFALK